MISTSDGRGDSQTRTYDRAESVVFLKTNEQFGGLSNMASGFPLRVNGIRIFTSEALYQACRFPHRPELQRLIIGQASPMTAKMKSKPYRHDTRPDWDRVRVKIMRWCLHVKLVQNWDAFSELLLKTGDRPIVEQSRKDAFWGAKETEDGTLVGRNVLGRLLMELREAVKTGDKDTLLRAEPLQIPDFLLDGRLIGVVQPVGAEKRELSPHLTGDGTPVTAIRVGMRQASLFDPLAVKEASSPEYASGSPKSPGIAALKPYHAMKDSCVPWLREVPTHWEVLPNRVLFAEVKERNHSDEQMLSVTISKGVIRQQALLADSSKKDSSNQDKSAYKLVCPRDIAYNKMRAWQGAIGISDFRGIVSPAYVVLRLRNGQNPRYFHHLYRTPMFAKEAERWSYGITSDMWSLRPEHFKMIYTALPPLPEQSAIVRFIDHFDHRINRLIRAKQKMISLLNEQKQAIIHRTVTRGLDPNALFKPSGIDWLGHVPEHWEVKRLRHVGEAVIGLTYEPNDVVDEKSGVLVLRASNVANGRIVFEDSVFVKHKIPERLRTRSGDILICSRSGSRALIGKNAKIDGLAVGVTFGTFMTVFRSQYNDYLLHVFNSKLFDYQSGAFLTSTINQLTIGNLYSFAVPLPPPEEQAAIVRFLDEAAADFDRASAIAQREIDLLREYRTRLIADVVTGKLDVRGVEIPSLDAGEALDDLDTAEDIETEEMTAKNEVADGDEQ